MVRTTRKLAAVARKALSRKPPTPVIDDLPTDAAPAAPTSAPRKAPVKKAPVEKAPVKKAPVKKAPVTKAAPAKEVAAAKKAAPAKKAPAVKKAPAARAPVTSAAPADVQPVTTQAPRVAQGAADLAVRTGEEAWTEAELAEVLDELRQARDHSLEILAVKEAEVAGLMRDSGDGAGHDQADVGATSFERDHELAVVSSEHDKVDQIDRALGRIDDGTYGVCESCGDPIGKMRVMAFPRATMCMSCKQREERR